MLFTMSTRPTRYHKRKENKKMIEGRKRKKVREGEQENRGEAATQTVIIT